MKLLSMANLFTLAILVIFHVPLVSSLRDLINVNNELDNQAEQDYSTAMNGRLINAAEHKTATLKNGTNCSFSRKVVRSIRSYPPNFSIDGTISDGTSIQVNCADLCSEIGTAAVTENTPSGSLTKLQSSENAIQGSTLTDATYVMAFTIDGSTDTSLEYFLIITFRENNNNYFAHFEIGTSNEPGKYFLKFNTEFANEPKTIELNEDQEYFLTTMVDRQTQSTVMMIDSLEVLEIPSVPSSYVLQDIPAYTYTVQDWKIYNRLLTMQELHKIMNDGKELMAQTGRQCSCPQEFPLFTRWRHISDDVWSGLDCHSVNGSTANRINPDSHDIQFTTDGDDFTYWISSTDPVFTKITIDLGTAYEIFYATLAVLTVPEHLVITKTFRNTEDVLFLATNDCSSTSNLPDGLPRGTPLRCETDMKVYQSNAGNDKSGVMLLDWANTFLVKNLQIDIDSFHAARLDGKFSAESVSIYMYGYEALAVVHAIHEIKIYGSCGCSARGGCSLENVDSSSASATGTNGASGVSGPLSRVAKRALRIMLIPQRIHFGYTFQEVYGYKCSCSAGYSGSLCQDCATNSYMIGEDCTDCNCYSGALNQSCDASGQCYCDTSRLQQTQYSNKKCHPFVSSIEPSFGPLAGGTLITITGGWLRDVQYATIGFKECYALENRTHTDSQFSCLTPEANSPALVQVNVTDIYSTTTRFTYKPNPNITVIGRVEVTTSGGVDIPIAGTNLDSIANPKIQVTIICKSTSEEIATLQGDCKALDSQNMNCKSPDFTGSLQNSACLASPSRRRKRAAGDNSDLYEFAIGFVLDGVEEFEEAKDSPWLEKTSQMVVQPNPVVLQFSDNNRIRVVTSNQRQLEIAGQDMESGTVMQDYMVKIGVGNCTTTILYHNLLKCEMPDQLPAAGNDWVASPYDETERIPAVVVSVGNIHTQVGYLVEEPIMPSPQTEHLAIAVAVPVVVVSLLVICGVAIFMFVRRKRHIQVKKVTSSTKMSARYVYGPQGKGFGAASDPFDSEYMEQLQDRLIPREHLELGNALGQGQFGKVFAGSLEMKSGLKKKVAVKTMKTDLLLTDVKAVPNFLQEAVLMKDFDHPNVLALIGVVLNEENIPMVVIPLMVKGDLKKVLRDEKEDFTVGDLLHFGLQAASGMSYLTEKSFIHRDLAARNCMVDEQYLVKIADFGLSHDIYGEDYYRVQDKTKPLPVKWMAYESLTSGKYTVQSDVWSYGVLLWEILTRGETPYPGVNNYEIKDFLKIGKKLDRPSFCPDEVYDLMCQCWDLTPSDRPNFSKICELLASFMQSDGEYSRHITSQIEDDYLVQTSVEGDSPMFSEPASDYDIAEPVFAAPGNPTTSNDQPSLNKSNNNSNRFPQPSERTTVRKVTSDNDYLQPTLSLKKPNSALSLTGIEGSITSSGKSVGYSKKGSGKSEKMNLTGMKLATQTERSNPNTYLHVF